MTNQNGRALFQGIMLQIGPVADAVHSSNGGSIAVTPEAKRVVRGILDDIDRMYPSFYRVFKARVTSGRHGLIERALVDGARTLKEAVHSNIKPDPEDLASAWDEKGLHPIHEAEAHIYHYAWLYTGAHVYADYDIFSQTIWVIDPGRKTQQGKQLQQEMLIQRIADLVDKR